MILKRYMCNTYHVAHIVEVDSEVCESDTEFLSAPTMTHVMLLVLDGFLQPLQQGMACLCKTTAIPVPCVCQNSRPEHTVLLSLDSFTFHQPFQPLSLNQAPLIFAFTFTFAFNAVSFTPLHVYLYFIWMSLRLRHYIYTMVYMHIPLHFT